MQTEITEVLEPTDDESADDCMCDDLITDGAVCFECYLDGAEWSA